MKVLSREKVASVFQKSLIAFVSLSPVTLSADESLCLGSCPIGSPATSRIVDHDILRLSHNPNTKFADWVAYVVTIQSKSGTEDRRNFRGDPLVPNDEELEKSDYKDAAAEIGINKGHQAPLASFSGSPHWYKTNYMTNITPQQNDLNKGSWKRLEDAIRDLADYGYPVFVMTGTLYERPMTPLPQSNEPHVIPSGYWKIVTTFEENEYWSAAFILDQNASMSTSHCTGAVTVVDVERRAGLDFFTTLGFSNELAIETGNNDLVPWLGCDK